MSILGGKPEGKKAEQAFLFLEKINSFAKF
jgi:hypothetical protein